MAKLQEGKVVKAASETVSKASKVAGETVSKASKAASETVTKASKVAGETVTKASKAASETVTKASKVASEKVGKATEKVKAVKTAITEEIVLQYAGKEMTPQQIMDAAKAQYVAEGHKASEIKGIKVYIKPEDGRAYFVVNDSYAGSIAL